jgi:hypothetical protein
VTTFCQPDEGGAVVFCSLLGNSGFGAGAVDSTGTGDADINHVPFATINIARLKFAFAFFPNRLGADELLGNPR